MVMESKYNDLTHDSFIEDIVSGFKKESVSIKRNEDLALKTTFRIGGKARFFLEPLSEEALGEIVRVFSLHGISWKILGAGSNVLVSDKGIRDPVISLLSCKSSITPVSESSISTGSGITAKRLTISVDGGVKVRKLLGLCIRMGWSGCEFLAGIPATIGGAVFMNAGTSDGAMADIVSSIEIMEPSGKVSCMSRDHFSPGYRSSGIPDGHIVLGARIGLVKTSPEKVAERIKMIIMRRKSTQPINYPSAGCIFKNPPPDYPPAGWLIDRCGLKGYRIGDAQVSPIHANWIVNLGNATATDVLRLIDYVKAEVLKTFGIQLEEEICFWE